MGMAASSHRSPRYPRPRSKTRNVERRGNRNARSNAISRRLDEFSQRQHPLRRRRDEGIGTGAFTYDFKNHEVRVANVKATLRPAEAIFWIDPKLWKAVAPYKFRQPPNINANGVYQFRGGKKTRLEVTVDAVNGMEYDFLGKALPFDRVSGRLLFTNDRLQ